MEAGGSGLGYGLGCGVALGNEGGRTVKALLIPVKVLVADNLPLSARLLFFLILLKTRESGKACTLTQDEMATILGVSRSTVYRDLRVLLSAGLIKIEGHRKYVALDPDRAKDQAAIEKAKLRVAHAKSIGQGLLQALGTEVFDDDSFIADARLDCMTNKKTGAQLELDLYSAKYKVAFEFNGAQHEGPTELYPDEEEAGERQMLDDVKVGLCVKNGIKLIIVRPEDLSVQRLLALVGDALPLRPGALDSAVVAYLEKMCYFYRRKALRSSRSATACPSEGTGEGEGTPRERSGSIRRFIPRSGSKGNPAVQEEQGQAPQS